MRKLFGAAAALLLAGLAAGSAMLATTPACELLTGAELDGAAGRKMISQGGTADFEHISECFWQSEEGRPSLQFSLIAAAMFSPSGQTARDHLDFNMDAMEKAGSTFEWFPQIGDGAFLSETPETHFVGLAAGGDYLSIGLTGGKRETILAIAKAAAKAMSAR